MFWLVSYVQNGKKYKTALNDLEISSDDLGLHLDEAGSDGVDVEPRADLRFALPACGIAKRQAHRDRSRRRPLRRIQPPRNCSPTSSRGSSSNLRLLRLDPDERVLSSADGSKTDKTEKRPLRSRGRLC